MRTFNRIALSMAIMILSVGCCTSTHTSAEDKYVQTFFRKGGNHTNNWAVLVDTSRFWFNYRHSANALSIYRTLKRMGVGDDRIILMLADDAACDPRNSSPGTVFNNRDHRINLYGESVEVDYRGYEVTVENFIRLLTDRHDASVPRSKRLLADKDSNVLIYMTGHGGNEFIKFQDAEEISSLDLADAIEQMHRKQRYNELFFMVDTCQAATLFSRFYSPNVLAIGSSLKKENSYSHHHDEEIGVSVIDRFTHHTLDFFERRLTPDSTATIADLFKTYDFASLGSNVLWTTENYPRPLNQVFLTEFFGSVTPIELTQSPYPVFQAQDVEPEREAEATAPVAAVTLDDSFRSTKVEFYSTQAVTVAAAFLVGAGLLCFII